MLLLLRVNSSFFAIFCLASSVLCKEQTCLVAAPLPVGRNLFFSGAGSVFLK